MSRTAWIAVVLGVGLATGGGYLLGCAPKESESDKYFGQLNREREAEEEKVRLLDASKAIGIAAIGTVDNAHPEIPGPDTFKERVRPNLADKFQKDLDRFEWKFPGGKPAEIDDVANVELGRLTGEDGAAVVYADGAARWVVAK